LHLDAQLDAERRQQRRDRAPVTQLRHPPLLHLVPGHVVVEQAGGLSLGHEMRQRVVGDRLAGGQRRDGPAKQRGASGVAALAHGREAVQQQVGQCRPGVRWLRHGADRPQELGHPGLA